MATKFDEQLKALRVDIKGQDHKLAWITDEEAKLLKSRGGSGNPGPMGIPSYPFDDFDEPDEQQDDQGKSQDNQGYVDDIEREGDFDPNVDLAGRQRGDPDPTNTSGDPSVGSMDPGDTFGQFDDPGGFYSFDPKTGDDRGPTVDEAYNAYVNDFITRDGFTSLTGKTDDYLDDLIDQKTVEDFQREMNERGIDVTIGWDRETGVPTIDGTWKNAMDAFGVGFTTGLSPLGDFAQFAIGGTLGTFGMPGAFSPAGFLANVVMGRGKQTAFGYNVAGELTTDVAKAIGELTGQPNLGKSVGQTINELNQGYADITKGITDMRNEVKQAVAEALGFVEKAPDISGLTQQQTPTEEEQGKIDLSPANIDVRGGSFIEQVDRGAYAFTG